MERYSRAKSLTDNKEKERLERFITKVDLQEESLINHRQETMKVRKLARELKKIKNEGVIENLERLKRIKVNSQNQTMHSR